MKTFSLVLLSMAAFVLTGASTGVTPASLTLAPVEPIRLPPGIDVFFTPHDDIEAELIKIIDSAKSEILSSQYLITSRYVVQAMLRAQRDRGVVVAVILEPSPNVTEYQTPEYLRLNGIPVLFRNEARGINNHKYWVIDRSIVVTGSYDATKAAAGSNEENLLKVKDTGLAIAYYNAWVEQASRSKPLYP